MRCRYFTITPYRLVDGVVHKGVAPLQVRHLPVRPHQEEFAPLSK